MNVIRNDGVEAFKDGQCALATLFAVVCPTVSPRVIRATAVAQSPSDHIIGHIILATATAAHNNRPQLRLIKF